METVDTERVREIARQEATALREIEKSQKRIEELEKQVLGMVDRVEIGKREVLIASLEKQITENKAALTKKEDHPAMAAELLACPECRNRLIEKGMKDIFIEDPEKLKQLICDSTGCHWVFTPAEKPKSNSEIINEAFPEEEETKSGFTLGKGGDEDE